MVTSAYDRTKYKTKNGTVKNLAVYMITSNIMYRYVLCVCTQYKGVDVFRVERTGDREHIQVYQSFEGSQEENRACKQAVI